MGDQNRLLQYVNGGGAANNFGPLTPEQQMMLQRQAVSTEGISPLDFLIPGGIGVMAGRQLGRGVARVGEGLNNYFTPNLSGLAIMGGYNPAATINTAGRIGAGVVGGAAGLSGMSAGPSVRSQLNTWRDAEGQPGGYYGAYDPASYYQDAEGQPGGFYGMPRR